MLKRNVRKVVLILLISFSIMCQLDDNIFAKRSVKVNKSRHALVIGNSGYLIGPLKNPVNDANDVSDLLNEYGFKVIHKTNASQREMEEAIRSFGTNLQGGGTGLFYFAGHGVQIGGRNYLIPVDAEISKEADVKYESVDVGRVLDEMHEADNGLNIIILDACRNNPFSRSFRSIRNGLAQMDAPSGTIISYSTSPDSVAADGEGRNGIYTKFLIENIKIPDLAIEQVFKNIRIDVIKATNNQQIPWESSSLIGNFIFNNTIDSKRIVSSEKANEIVIVSNDNSIYQFNDLALYYSKANNEYHAVIYHKKGKSFQNEPFRLDTNKIKIVFESNLKERITIADDELVALNIGSINHLQARIETFYRFNIVVDHSASNSVSDLNTLHRSIAKFITKMPLGSEIQIIKFSNEIKKSGFTRDKGKIIEFLNSPIKQGTTALHDAIFFGITELKNTKDDAFRFSLVIADGKDTSSREFVEKEYFLNRISSVLNEYQTPVFSIGLTGDSDEELLKKISTKGLYQHIDGIYDIDKGLDEVNSIIQNTYIFKIPVDPSIMKMNRLMILYKNGKKPNTYSKIFEYVFN